MNIYKPIEAWARLWHGCNLVLLKRLFEKAIHNLSNLEVSCILQVKENGKVFGSFRMLSVISESGHQEGFQVVNETGNYESLKTFFSHCVLMFQIDINTPAGNQERPKTSLPLWTIGSTQLSALRSLKFFLGTIS